MGIIRVRKKETNYSVIDNYPLTDKNLTWGARGMLSFLLSKPDNWQVNEQNLINESPAGRDATRTIIRELKHHRYMKRIRYQDDNGRFYYITEVYERPYPAEEQATADGKPGHGNTVTGKTVNGSTVNGSTVNGKPGDLTSTELPNTDINIEQSAEEILGGDVVNRGKNTDNTDDKQNVDAVMALAGFPVGEEIKNKAAYRAVSGYYERQKRLQQDISEYPEDVRPVIEKMITLWKLDVPTRSKAGKGRNRFELWLRDAEELMQACAEYGLHVIDLIHQQYTEQKQKNGGSPPYMVVGPKSLTGIAGGVVGQLRESEDNFDVGGTDLTYYLDGKPHRKLPDGSFEAI